MHSTGSAAGSPPIDSHLTVSGERDTAKGLPSAVTLLGGTLLSLTGLTWDMQWHNDVGPDTFFTLPHLFLYAGSAVAGLVSLGVVLATTAAQRADRPIDPAIGGRTIRLPGGAFFAPLGYLVSGIGAASFLLYGLWDQWWHSLYGFDAMIDSPPHIGLLLSITVTIIGMVMVFASARGRSWSMPGVLTALAVLLAFSTVTCLGMQRVGGQIDWVSTTTVLISVTVLVIAAGLTRSPGQMVWTAVIVGVIQLLAWWFSPWAAHAYADLVDLPLRDYARTIPVMPALIPATLLGGAAVIELILLAGKAMRWTTRAVLPIAGMLAGVLIALTYPLQQQLIYRQPLSLGGSVPTVIVSGVLGAAGAYVGWQFGAMLRLLVSSTDDKFERG